MGRADSYILLLMTCQTYYNLTMYMECQQYYFYCTAFLIKCICRQQNLFHVKLKLRQVYVAGQVSQYTQPTSGQPIKVGMLCLQFQTCMLFCLACRVWLRQIKKIFGTSLSLIWGFVPWNPWKRL